MHRNSRPLVGLIIASFLCTSVSSPLRACVRTCMQAVVQWAGVCVSAMALLAFILLFFSSGLLASSMVLILICS